MPSRQELLGLVLVAPLKLVAPQPGMPHELHRQQRGAIAASRLSQNLDGTYRYDLERSRRAAPLRAHEALRRRPW
jgi:hypothetical protein